VRITRNLAGARWSKLAMNCAMSTLGAVSGLSLGELAFTPGRADARAADHGRGGGGGKGQGWCWSRSRASGRTLLVASRRALAHAAIWLAARLRPRSGPA